MFILGIHNGEHDASACLFDDYRLLAAVSLERLTRKKNAGVSVDAEWPFAAIDECLACAGIGRHDIDVICVSRGHFEHALIYTADGIGDNISYSVSVGKPDGIEILSGGDGKLLGPYEVNSIGYLYGFFTIALGYVWHRHEGKLTGLAGYGKPVAADEIVSHFSVS